MEQLAFIFWIIIGTAFGSLLSVVPALHVFNVAGIIVLINMKVSFIPASVFPYFMLSLVVAYAMINTIPSIFFSAPDDSMLFVVLPGQQYMLQGRGYEASVLTGIGSLGGFIFIFLMTPLVFNIFPKIKKIVSPHLFWILGLVIAFMLMSEWPKGSDRAPTGWGRFLEGWSNLFAGLLTFILSGIMGIIIMNRSLVRLEMAFQGIMPVFVGLFAIPGIIQNLLAKIKFPQQHIAKSVDCNIPLFLRGSAAGFLGGLFAAFFPVVTGGVGGLLAGHATSQRDQRLFIISQGASKTVYYVGAFLLAFAPGLALTRGGMSWIVSPFFTARLKSDYFLALSAIAISGALAFFLLLYFTKLVTELIMLVKYQIISIVVLFILIGIIFGMTGWMGLFLMSVATCIGSIPVFFYSRRMNCMGVLLVPITLNLAGLGAVVNKLLGLV